MCAVDGCGREGVNSKTTGNNNYDQQRPSVAAAILVFVSFWCKGIRYRTECHVRKRTPKDQKYYPSIHSAATEGRC